MIVTQADNFLRQQTARLQAADPAIDMQAQRRSATPVRFVAPRATGTKTWDLTLHVRICTLVAERTLGWLASISRLSINCENCRIY
jgi:hypothetical protein